MIDSRRVLLKERRLMNTRDRWLLARLRFSALQLFLSMVIFTRSFVLLQFIVHNGNPVKQGGHETERSVEILMHA
jgi:hypothetical protein